MVFKIFYMLKIQQKYFLFKEEKNILHDNTVLGMFKRCLCLHNCSLEWFRWFRIWQLTSSFSTSVIYQSQDHTVTRQKRRSVYYWSTCKYGRIYSFNQRDALHLLKQNRAHSHLHLYYEGKICRDCRSQHTTFHLEISRWPCHRTHYVVPWPTLW